MFDGLYHPFMIFIVIWGTGYYCFNHIYDDHLGIFPVGFPSYRGHQCQQRLTAAESHCLGAAWRTCTVAVVHPGDGNSNKKQGNFHGENDEPLDWTLGSRFSEPYWKSIG